MNPTAVRQFIDRLGPAFEEDDADAAGKIVEAGNIARLRQQYEAIARGDFAAFLDTLAEEVELEIAGPPGVPFVGRWQGRQQVVEAVGRNFALVEEQQPEILAVVAQGDVVVVTARERGRYRATGRSYDLQWVQFFTFRQGKVVRVREVFDTATMLAAVTP